MPAPNPDAEQLLPVFQYLPHVFEQRAWTNDEKQALKDAIQQIVQVRLERADQNRAGAPCSPRWTARDRACHACGSVAVTACLSKHGQHPLFLFLAASHRGRPLPTLMQLCSERSGRSVVGALRSLSIVHCQKFACCAGGRDQQTPGRDHVLERRHGR